MPTQETKWTLPTPDGKTIYGVKNTAGQGASKAVFIAHGLTGHMYEYQVKRAADYFTENGYDVYRFNLYDGAPDARDLIDCTLQTHADDLSTILDAFAGEYAKVFLIGHSYGGPTVMLNPRPQATAFSLWDPSFDLKDLMKEFSFKYDEKEGYYLLNWGTHYLMGKAMYEHSSSLDETACTNLAKANPVPTQVILAGGGYYVKKQISYHSFGHPKNRRDVVEGTVHCFYEGQTCEDLLAKTHNWFKSF